MPSPIDTPMLNDFRKVAGDAVLSAFAKAKGRYSSAQEQAQPLILEHEMGELFKVIGLAAGAGFDAVGFAAGDRSHTL